MRVLRHFRLVPCWRRSANWLVLATAIGAGVPASFAYADENNPRDQANGVLGLMSFVVIPDATVSFLSIEKAVGADDLKLLQVGGSTYWREGYPLYLEGYFGLAQYEPRFILDSGSGDTEVQAHWTNWAATAGVGWDFVLMDDLVLRPIANFSFGQVSSDATIPRLALAGTASSDAAFLHNGKMNAIGFGGSIMLDYRRQRSQYEIDVELRLTAIRLESVGGTSATVKGSANAASASIWSRYRLPSNERIFGLPLFYVLDGAHSRFLGQQSHALGVNHMTQVGAGFEMECEEVGIGIERARLIARYFFGGDLNGFSISFGVSF